MAIDISKLKQKRDVQLIYYYFVLIFKLKYQYQT